MVLDFGGQYAHLIASRIRRFGYKSEIRDSDTPAHLLASAAGIILSGGPQSVYEKNGPQADKAIFDLGIPILGICYGHQWLAHALGGKVTSGHTKEYGRMQLEIVDSADVLFKGLPHELTVWMSHGDEVSGLPDGFHRTAQTENCSIAAMANDAMKIYGVQFHLEVTHTQEGMGILRRFVDLCKPDPWNMKSYSYHISQQIKHEVGDRKVFMLVSGGVDSTVAFTLLNKVLGADRVQGMLVDTGLMRKNEVMLIDSAMKKLGITNLHIEDASALFFARLHGVYEPEAKRKIIGDTFLDVQRDVAKKMQLEGADWMLGQGTIYPDTIETGGTKNADKIKTHHNRVPAIAQMIDEGRVIEPLKELYKDEVRELGEEIGLPHALVWRHPFPGPGLGVRILCAEGAAAPAAIETRRIVQFSNHQIDEMNLQSPAGASVQPKISIPDLDIPHTILPIKSVGVQGDGRTYRQAIVLFDEHKAPKPVHWEMATSIPNSNPQFSRVLVCTSQENPTPFVVTPSFITKQRAELLREADAVVDEEMRKAELYESIWQFPVVLLPLGLQSGGQTIVLRPVHSEEAMTANAIDLPRPILERMTNRLMELDGIDAVFLDLTNKPPGTIEWE